MPIKTPSKIEHAFHFIHKNFLWILLASYLVAVFFPQPGLWIRDVDFGTINLARQGELKISLSLVMLSFLLFNAGFGVRTAELRNLVQKPQLLALGLLANTFVPSLFILFVRIVCGILWHSPDEIQNILVGLALIAAMPIAGSSTAWAQNSNGNLALSLGFVIFSTVFSPLTTPVVLHMSDLLTTGDYSEDLHELATTGASMFLIFTIVIPSLFGIFLKAILGQERVERFRTPLKFINLLNLLLLNYSNASVSLPQMLESPHWGLFSLILFLTFGLGVVSFGSGALLARWLRLPLREKSSVIFALGMNNNGSGLVLASLSLADHPLVMLPIIFYNLVQQLLAGFVDHRLQEEQSNP